MRKGISKTAVIYLALGAIIILIFMLFIGQQKGKADETIFTKVWKMFFPETTETVIIKGTTVGKSSCGVIEITDANHLARVMAECWATVTEMGGVEWPCCHKVSPKKLKAAITKEQVTKELMTLGEDGREVAEDPFVWKVGTVQQADSEFKVCYDADFDHEISVTRGTSDTDCDD